MANFSQAFLFLALVVVGIETIVSVLHYQLYLIRERQGKAPLLTYRAWLRQLTSIGYFFLIGIVLSALLFPESPISNNYAPLTLRLAGACICIIGGLIAFFCGLLPYLLVRGRRTPGRAAFHLFEYVYVVYVTLLFLSLIFAGEIWFLPALFRLFLTIQGVVAGILLFLVSLVWIGSIWLLYKVFKHFR